MKYLVDSDWIIDLFRGIESIRKKFLEFEPYGIALSMISLAELYEGIIHSKDPMRGHDILDSFLSSGIEVMNIDTEICKTFGNERGKLRRNNKLIGDFDLLIASTAIAYDLTLLSNNRKHYERIDGLKIISI